MHFDPFYNIENPELLGFEYAWVDFITNGHVTKGSVSKDIQDSWGRCRKMGVDPSVTEIFHVKTEYKDLELRRATNRRLIEASLPVMENLLKVFTEDDLRIWIADSDGIILMDFDKTAHLKNSSLSGSIARESVIGTNSTDMALRKKEPTRIAGAEHFCQAYQNNACYSAPIHDENDEIAGTIGISVLCENMNDYMLSMASVAAQTITNEMNLRLNTERIASQELEKREIVDRSRDGIVYLDAQNRISFVNLRFCDMMDRNEEELLGRSIDVIKTSPELHSVPEAPDYRDAVRIVLHGKDREYSCFLTKKVFSNQESKEERTILVFMVEDEIQAMADKANASNKAYFSFDDLIGESDNMLGIISLAKKASTYEAGVLLEGESGTGKEVFAQAIHNEGARRNGPFIAIDCGAIPRELIESEMFGYEEGSFTGARKGGSRGKFEQANNGTLFLDEIENMPLDMQAKFLRVLQEKQIVRIGGNKAIPFDAQIIASSNVDLKKEIEKNTFREDLFYRLDIMHIRIPPLRERKSDIPLIINEQIKSGNERMKKHIKGISPGALQILMNFEWPGNVRQLANIIERMMIMTDEEVITEKYIPEELLQSFLPSGHMESGGSGSFVLREGIQPMSQAEAIYARYVVDQMGGNIKKASEALGISRSKVYRLLERIGNDKEGEVV